MRILSVYRKLSVLERCPYSEVRRTTVHNFNLVPKCCLTLLVPIIFSALTGRLGSEGFYVSTEQT